MNNIVKIIKEKGNEINKGYVYVLPGEVEVYSNNKLEIEKRTCLNIKIFAVNDKAKYDPNNKSKNVKPGRPGIYLE